MMVIHAWRDVISEPFEELYNQILEVNGFPGWKCKFIYEDPNVSDKDADAQRSLDACKAGLITLDRFYAETERDPIQGDEGDAEGERERLMEWFKMCQKPPAPFGGAPSTESNSPDNLKANAAQDDKKKDSKVLTQIKKWLPAAIGVLAAHKYFSLGEDATKVDIEVIAAKASPALLEAATSLNAGLWEKVADAISNPALNEGINVATKEALSQGITEEATTALSRQDLIDEYFKEHGGEFIKTLSETDAKRVTDLIRDNVGLHEDAFQKQYEDSFPDDVRLDRIKRVESHRARQWADHETSAGLGAIKKERVTAGDERVRETHTADAEEGPIDFNSPYPHTGEMYPGESEIECRCGQKIYFTDPEKPDNSDEEDTSEEE
jgi:hypothetical protein